MTSGPGASAAAAGLISLFLITGCVDAKDSAVVSDPSPATEEVPDLPELPPGATAQGVVLAAFLLANGDIERVVESALVSPEEVELAREAIASDTLQDWIVRASAD